MIFLQKKLPVTKFMLILSADFQTANTTGERLPSCMTVAGEYNVSKSTAHNAYRRLESDGYIIFTRTGTFVADISGLSPHTSLAELLIDTIERARQNGISDEDITGALEILMERYC